MKNPIVKYIVANHFLFTVLLVGFAFFLYEIKAILLALFIAYILMASLNPFVIFLRKRGVPKIVALLATYFFVIAFIILLIVPIFPFFIDQVQALFKAIPGYTDKAGEALGTNITKDSFNSLFGTAFNSVGKNAVQITSRVFGGIFSIVAIFILSFYLLLDRERYEKSIPSLFPEGSRAKVKETMLLVEDKLGAWLRGQIVLSLAVGAITWVALTILGIPYALPLAILAGVLEIIPTLGPIIAAVPATIVALGVSPLSALTVVLAYTAIQLAENNILVPKIMQKAVGLNPVLVIIAILIGGSLLGVPGALLSIPFVSALIIVIKAFDN